MPVLVKNVMFFAVAVVIGTGAYVLAPASMYLLIAAIALLFGLSLIEGTDKIDVKSQSVLLLYAAFLLINYLRDADDGWSGRLYLNFYLGLCTYLIIVKTLSREHGLRTLPYVPLVSLAVIALGLILHMNGMINFREDQDTIEAADVGLLLRPGGFLNPNMSAALSLIWLYVALESKVGKSNLLKFTCLMICLAIVVITQSRAALLALTIYFGFKLLTEGKQALKYAVALLVLGLPLLMYFGESGFLTDLYKANFERAQGDASSQERRILLAAALDTFTNNPIVGGGMRAMFQFFGLGTHNELGEWLVNFGLLGFSMMALIFIRFYYIPSFPYLCLCIIPTFMFSHNFFETTAFQAALAYAASLYGRERDERLQETLFARRTQMRVPLARYNATGMSRLRDG